VSSTVSRYHDNERPTKRVMNHETIPQLKIRLSTLLFKLIAHNQSHQQKKTLESLPEECFHQSVSHIIIRSDVFQLETPILDDVAQESEAHVDMLSWTMIFFALGQFQRVLIVATDEHRSSVEV